MILARGYEFCATTFPPNCSSLPSGCRQEVSMNETFVSAPISACVIPLLGCQFLVGTVSPEVGMWNAEKDSKT